jgi:hypothetical protein
VIRRPFAMRLLAAGLLFLFSVPSLTTPALVAQDAAALTAREQKLATKVVPVMHTIADGFQGQRQHLRALELRRAIWQNYAENDDKARDKCGFVKVGDLWRHDADRLVLDKNFKGDPKILKKLDTDLAALQKEMVGEHRALATGWTALADADRATWHWQRLLQLAPADKAASAALALQTFDGVRGTAFELGVLRRARAIRSACDWLNRTSFPITDTGAEKHPLLVAAKVDHSGRRSEHFTVWGNLPPAELELIAMDCERALLMAHTWFGTWRGTAFAPARARDLVFLVDPDQYGAVLDQCQDQFDASRLAFLKKDVDQAFVEHPGKPLRLHKAHLGIEASRDQAVRGVVQDAVGLYTEGLYEGIGHTACGFLFGRTLTFLVEQQKAKTVASWQPRLLAPDLATWMKIAEESAWSKSDTRTSELVLLSAARFTTEQRVKAWAICHYLLHWRPDLLHELDASPVREIPGAAAGAQPTKVMRTAPEVEAEFLRRTTLSLPKIDHDWREFWGRSAQLREAMVADPIPAEKSPERPAKLRARSIVDAVNVARAAAMRGPAGFVVAQGPEVATVVTFDEQLNKAEVDRKKKPKETIALPVAPGCNDRTVLWSRQKDATAAVAEWLLRPTVRDALLHPGRDLFGAATAANTTVLDIALPAMPTRSGLPLCWPRHGQKDVPAAAPGSALGPRALAALAAAGKPVDTVGTPLSLHFARAIAPADLAKIECRVYVGTQEVTGVLVRYDAPAVAGDAAADDGDTADGLVAFVPFAPLPAKALVEVMWALPASYLPKDENFPAVKFTVQ